MAADDLAPPPRMGGGHEQSSSSKLPPPLQPRSRTPKGIEKSSSAAHSGPHQPVRPAPLARAGGGAIAYAQSMFGRDTSGDGRELQPPRPKQELDKEELTTKGRKRKRLAKACSACHKNKRRCDGFAPCSNCEFSARACIYLNAQGEQIPPPRTRDSSATPVTNKRPSNDEGKPQALYAPEQRLSGGAPGGAAAYPAGEEWRREYRDGERAPPPNAAAAPKAPNAPNAPNGGGNSSNHAAPNGGDVPPAAWRGSDGRSFSPLEVVERDYALAAELIDICLKRTPPYAAMFHPPTFYNRYYLARTSPFLLDAMFAVAARLCESPTFVSAFPPNIPTHLRGQAFADRCRANLDRVIEIRRHWADEENMLNQGTWEETEVVQAALLISVFYCSTRQPRLGLYYLEFALTVLCPNSSGVLAPPSSRMNLTPAEYFTLAEIRNRTFWLCVLGDVCSAAAGRRRMIQDHEIANVPLPGPEMHWARWGGMATGSREPGRRDCLTIGTGNWHAEEGQVGELGHIMRIMTIFSNIMALSNNGGPGSLEVRHLPAGHYEQALKAWALDLPRHLRFDEVNLSLSIGKLNSPVPEVAFSGWAFTYMHSVAECGMFYLQNKQTASYTVQRQGQAVDNLSVIINSLGERGREGPLFCFPIMVVTSWMEHLSANSPNPAQTALEEPLRVWWAEQYREWGWDRRETIERGVIPLLDASMGGEPRHPMPLAAPTSAKRRSFFEPQMGLYPPSSPHQAADSSASSAASHHVATPSESSYPTNGGNNGNNNNPSSRYPQNALRPRELAGGYHTPSPPPQPRGHRHMGSISSAGSAERPGPNGEGMITLPPLSFRGQGGPLVDREYEPRDRDVRERVDRGRMEREREQRDVREREREHDFSDREHHSPHMSPHDPRPLAAPAVKREQWPTSNSGGPLLGIDALVSAAEEHRRESLEKQGSGASAIPA